MLMRRWERARQGDGQLVLIVGEPGIGKSRLIEEFHARLRDTPHTWVEWSCSQLLQNTPLHPIAEWGRQRFGGADVPRRAAPRGPGEFAGAGQARPGGKYPLACAAAGHSAAAGTRADFGAGGIAAPAIGGADQLGDGGRAGPAGGAGVRGSALGRSDHARCVARHRRARRAGAACSSWRRRGPSSARPGACARITARSRWRRSIADQVRDMVAELSARHALPTRGDRRRRRAHRRRAAVRRGSDAAAVGARRARRRHPGDPADAATIVDGAARPARPGARGGADRRGDRPRLFLRAAVAPWQDWRTRRCKPRWNGSPKPTSCWCRACRRNPIIVSSTR